MKIVEATSAVPRHIEPEVLSCLTCGRVGIEVLGVSYIPDPEWTTWVTTEPWPQVRCVVSSCRQCGAPSGRHMKPLT